jgi:hypothetical protein
MPYKKKDNKLDYTEQILQGKKAKVITHDTRKKNYSNSKAKRASYQNILSKSI